MSAVRGSCRAEAADGRAEKDSADWEALEIPSKEGHSDQSAKRKTVRDLASKCCLASHL